MIISAIVNKNYLSLKTLAAPELSCPFCTANGKIDRSFYQVQLDSGWVWSTKRTTAIARCNNCKLGVQAMQSLKDLNNFYNKEKRKIAVAASFKAGDNGRCRIWLAIVFAVIIVLLLWVLYLAA